MPSRRDFLRTTALAGTALSLGDLTPAGAQVVGPVPAAAPPAPPVARAERSLRILILGGTGLTGPFQVRYALARGHQVTVFNRGRHNERLPTGVTELRGDRNLHEVAPLKGQEWDVVLDNPVTLPFWVRDVGEILRGHTGHYIFTSTISVYDPKGQRAITEDSPLLRYTDGDPVAVTQEMFRQRFADLYGPLKAASEREAAKWFGNQVTIIRPGLIVGPGDATFRFTYWPWRISQGGEILAPGDGTDPVQVIDSRDLAEWTVRMAEARAFGTFNAAGPRSELSMAAQLHGARAAFDGTTDVRFTWVPAEFLAQHEVAPWQEMPTWLPGSDPESAIARTSNARALAAGLTFRPLATSAVDALAWFKEQPEAARAQIAKAAGLAPEKEQAVLAAWHAR